MFRRIFAAAVLLTGALAAAPAGAAPAPGPTWKACGGIGGECATVTVPVDWADPGGEKTEVAIGRVKASDPKHRIGVLFVAPGGPGVSGIDNYTLKAGLPDDSVLRQRFDIVTWDPRGVSRSHAVRCDAALLAKAPTTFPDTEQQYRDLVAYNGKLGADCRARTGALFDHVDTASAVRDLDAIRGALGEERLSFYGASYGTQVGQQYAELFPGRIRAMTIDSNMDHSLRSGGRYIETASEDLEGSFTAFADWCARTSGCALRGQDVREVWDDVLAKAEGGTLVDPKTGKAMTSEALQSELMNAMYHPEKTWYTEATRLQALAKGAPSDAAAVAKEDLAENSYQAIWCEDWQWRVHGYAELKSYRDAAARRAPHTRLSAFWSDVTSCLGWPAKVVNPQHRLSVRGAPTVLIVKGRYDVATPHAWNYAVADQLANSALLEYDGIGHGQYFNSRCVRDHVERYLLTTKTPDRGTRCAAVWPTTPPPAKTESLTLPTKPAHTS
ncbi:alpha/beta hydrolase [Amycolatopsis sp. CA-230715]|uniref:alpha/beta hydrolase n=1 Tax=Amycolatopsis sp. CA-230715 TaxID=2745196 RepID=UPI001C00A5DC|nr:alpha/beta hydrolase [Amycolatopsis sp. CA-230715]QWF77437.1 Carboxylesterase B [Amycolatopsis sp. CA-230715]